MSSQNKRFVFELANETDNHEILEILEENDFKGNIGLVYTRRPDPVQSFHLEGKHTEVLVCRDTKENTIAAVAAYTIRDLYLNGNPEQVGYLFALRSKQQYFKKYPLLHRGYAYLKKRLENHQVNYFITTILDENKYVQKLLEKERSFMPSYKPKGHFHLYALKRPKKSSFNFEDFYRASSETIEKVITFLNENGKNYQFYPVLNNHDLFNYPGLSEQDFYYLQDQQGNIIAAGACWNQNEYKQYLLQAYGGWFKFLYPFSKVLPLFGLPELPAPGSFLDFYTLSFWGVKNNDPTIFKKFLNCIAIENNHYPFYIVGMHENNPLIKSLQSEPKIEYKSKLYMVDWKKSSDSEINLSNNIPYLECGLL